MRGWMEALVMKKVALTITAIWIGLLLSSATSVVDGRVEARDMEGVYAVDAGTAKKCWNRGQETRPGAPRVVTMSGRITESQARKILARRAREVLLAIKNRDMAKLATLVQPSKGVRFSIYGNVSVEDDLVFTRNRIKDLFSNNQRYIWGKEAGSGDPMRLTARQYFKLFAYYRDFLRAKEIGYNKVIIGPTTMRSNIGEVYPDAIAVTYHFSGPDPDVPGREWKSLCLAFEMKNKIWCLRGIIEVVSQGEM